MGSGLFTEIQNPKKRAFLAAYAKCGLLVEAAKLAGCDVTMHYHWRKDPVYLEAFQLARDMVADLHEDEASKRAMGWDEERIAPDGTPYTIRKHSDVLLIVRLKALKPTEYRENLHVDTNVTLTVKLQDQLNTGLKRVEELRRGSDLRRLA